MLIRCCCLLGLLLGCPAQAHSLALPYAHCSALKVPVHMRANAFEPQVIAQADRPPLPGFDGSTPLLARSLYYAFAGHNLGYRLARDTSAAILQKRNSGELDLLLSPAPAQTTAASGA